MEISSDFPVRLNDRRADEITLETDSDRKFELTPESTGDMNLRFGFSDEIYELEATHQIEVLE